MLVGIHINHKKSLTPFSKGYIDILEYNNIDFEIMDIQDDQFWEKFERLDAFIFQVGHTSDMLQIADSFMPIIYNYINIPVFPNFNTLWHFDNKIKQHYLANYFNLKFVDSKVFWDKKLAINWIKETNFPLVMKLRGGAGSTNVTILRNPNQARHLINKAFSEGIKDSSFPGTWKVKYFPIKKYIHNRMIWAKRKLLREDTSSYWMISKNYVYYQKYLPNNNFDTRVTVIGDRAFAFRRFNRTRDFRASGSGKIDYDMDSIDKRMIKIALETSEECGFQCMAYDFLYDDENPVICEISYTYVDHAVYKCPGYWDKTLIWHSGHYMPQYFILKDLLNVNLVHPNNQY